MQFELKIYGKLAATITSDRIPAVGERIEYSDGEGGHYVLQVKSWRNVIENKVLVVEVETEYTN